MPLGAEELDPSQVQHLSAGRDILELQPCGCFTTARLGSTRARDSQRVFMLFIGIPGEK